MLCRGCRRQLDSGSPACRHCGRSSTDAPPPFDLILPDGTRVPVDGELVIGRAAGSAVQLLDPAVSRRHAVVSPTRDGLLIADADSRLGTYVDGARVRGAARLRDGAHVRIGKHDVVAELRRDTSAGGPTVVMRAPTVAVERCPRLRSGARLRRLPASEGPRRWVLQAAAGGSGVRLGAEDTALVELIDGRTSLAALVTAAAERLGDDGRARLARLLVELADRGMLEDVAASAAPAGGRLARLLRPRNLRVPGVGAALERLYSRGGWLLFSAPARVALGATMLAGAVAFALVVIDGSAVPFVVGGSVSVGAVAFILGRLALASLHEAAHGLTLASFGRSAQNAGVKFVAIFPYLFVDTTEAWMETGRRRIAVAAAGPVSDLSLGGLFALVAFAATGTTRDVAFQLAAGAYLGALLSLNPLLERDGYHILSDAIGEPNLRRRAHGWLAARIERRSGAPATPAVRRYALLALAWTLVAALAAIALTTRYLPTLKEAAPAPWIAWLLAVAFWLAILTPATLMIARPLLHRMRSAGERPV